LEIAKIFSKEKAAQSGVRSSQRDDPTIRVPEFAGQSGYH
jgi:hypothetical protein